MDAVRIQDLTKVINGNAVLSGCTLSILPGELFGIVGPNGAGKTTLLQCMFGLWAPTGGIVRALGLEPRSGGRELRKLACYLPVQPYARTIQSGRDHLELVAELYEVPRAVADRQIGDLAVAFGLEKVLEDPAGSYSAGQFKKLCLAGALLSNASLLILDEPFTGEVDPAGVATLKVILKKLCHERGATCVVTTQITQVAAELFDRIAILDRGRTVALGTLAEVTAQFGLEPHELERLVWELAGKQSLAAGLDFVDAVALRHGSI